MNKICDCKIKIFMILSLGIVISFLIGKTNTSLRSFNKIKAKDSFYKKEIKLFSSNEGYRLKIYESSDRSLTLKLNWKEYLIKSIRFGDSLTEDQLIKKVNLDDEKGKEYFITIYNRGSNYGAERYVILWEEDSNWEMITTPFKNAKIKDKDEDGIYEIIDYSSGKEKVYLFQNGFFIKK